MEKIHLRSLQCTLRENSGKAREKTKVFLCWVFILACAIVLITLTYQQGKWLYIAIAIGLLVLTIYYYTVLKSYWKTSDKIKQRIRQLNEQ